MLLLLLLLLPPLLLLLLLLLLPPVLLPPPSAATTFSGRMKAVKRAAGWVVAFVLLLLRERNSILYCLSGWSSPAPCVPLGASAAEADPSTTNPAQAPGPWECASADVHGLADARAPRQTRCREAPSD